MNNRIDLQFILLGTLMLIAGVLIGIGMGMKEDFTLVPVHAHANLVGWASLMLFGLTYRAYPSLCERKLAKVHFYVSGAAAVLLPIGIGFAVLKQEPALAIAASLLWLLGVIIFLIQVVSLFRVSERAAVPAE